MTDAELKKHIEEAVANLNKWVMHATKAGLTVEMEEVPVQTLGDPSHAHLTVRVTRVVEIA